MKKIILAGIILVSAVGLNSCYYDKYDELTAYQKLTSPCDSANVSFSKSVAPIFASLCNNCHSSSQNQGGVILDTYNGSLIVAQNGKLVNSIEHTSASSINYMPSGSTTKISDCKLKIIENWVSAGAKNN